MIAIGRWWYYRCIEIESSFEVSPSTSIPRVHIVLIFRWGEGQGGEALLSCFAFISAFIFLTRHSLSSTCHALWFRCQDAIRLFIEGLRFASLWRHALIIILRVISIISDIAAFTFLSSLFTTYFFHIGFRPPSQFSISAFLHVLLITERRYHWLPRPSFFVIFDY